MHDFAAPDLNPCAAADRSTSGIETPNNPREPTFSRSRRATCGERREWLPLYELICFASLTDRFILLLQLCCRSRSYFCNVPDGNRIGQTPPLHPPAPRLSNIPDISQIDCAPTTHVVGWIDDSLGWPLVLPFVLVIMHASTRLAPKVTLNDQRCVSSSTCLLQSDISQIDRVPTVHAVS